MQRDMVAIADNAKGKIPREYGLSVGEVQLLHEIRLDEDKGGELRAYGVAFRYGFAMGVRAAKRDRVSSKL